MAYTYNPSAGGKADRDRQISGAWSLLASQSMQTVRSRPMRDSISKKKKKREKLENWLIG